MLSTERRCSLCCIRSGALLSCANISTKVCNVAEQFAIIALYGVSCTLTQNIRSENVLLFREGLSNFFFFFPSNATTCSYELRGFPSWL